MSKTTFIYALTCPDTGEVKYVGKSDNPLRRLNDHALRSNQYPNDKNNWIKSLLDLGKRPNMIILEEIDYTEWQDAEKRWIEYYRLQNEGLTNIHNGGGNYVLTNPDCTLRVNLFISLEQYKALKKLVTSRISLSEHIRRAIDLYLEVERAMGDEQKMREAKR